MDWTISTSNCKVESKNWSIKKKHLRDWFSMGKGGKARRMSLLIMKLVPSFRGFKIGFETLRLWVGVRRRSRRRRRRRGRRRARHQSDTIAVKATVIAVVHHLHRRNFIQQNSIIKKGRSTKLETNTTQNPTKVDCQLWAKIEESGVRGSDGDGDRGPVVAAE